MSVVGFDIGNETCVIAVAKHRGIDVLLNEESKRETPAVVSFGEKQRFLGSAGAASAMMNPKSTVTQIKRLIGQKFNDADVQEELRRLPFSTLEDPDGGILVQLQYMGENQTFTAVQLLAMLFVHLKEIAEKNLGSAVSDCVIGIPSYFTDFQRHAYLNAAKVAGLKPFRLMHDCTATALSYGIYKTDHSNSIPHYVVFVDIGHCDTQVTVASFEVGHMKILSHAFDSRLGGRDFDEVLFNHFSAQFKEQYHIDVTSNVRACIRLRAACEKLKKVLSANAEAPISIECLMDEKDVKGFIDRKEFETLSSSLLDRIAVPCSKALADAHLSADRIHLVELVGSGSRIPAIGKMLTALFKREPSRTLNASECVARGCALQCAMLCPIFKVRDYEVQDSFPYSIGFLLDEGHASTPVNGILFPKGQTIPTVKVLRFLRSYTFHLEAFYLEPSELPPGVPPRISSCKIGPFHVSHNKKSKIKVRVTLNLHGIVSIESASLIDDEDDPGTRAINRPQSGKVEPEFVSDISSDLRANSSENGTHGQSEPSHPTAVASSDNQPVQADGKRKERSWRRIDVPVSHDIYGEMSKADLLEAHERECELAHQDRVMEQTKEKRNALESFIYETRDKLFDTYHNFVAESEMDEISGNLQKTEEWLYEDGDDESEKVYSDKLEDLKKLVNPIENRFRDEKARPQATRDLIKCIEDNRMLAKSLTTSEKDLINEECNKVEQWLQDEAQKQESLPKNRDPMLWSSEIRMKMETLNMTCRQRLRSKAKPADSTSKDDSMQS